MEVTGLTSVNHDDGKGATRMGTSQNSGNLRGGFWLLTLLVGVCKKPFPDISTVWFVGTPLISPGRVLPSQWLRFDKLHAEVPILSPSHSTHSSWSLIMLIYVHLISHSTKAGNKKCIWWIAQFHCSSSSKHRTYLSFICSIRCLSGIFFNTLSLIQTLISKLKLLCFDSLANYSLKYRASNFVLNTAPITPMASAFHGSLQAQLRG